MDVVGLSARVVVNSRHQEDGQVKRLEEGVLRAALVGAHRRSCSDGMNIMTSVPGVGGGAARGELAISAEILLSPFIPPASRLLVERHPMYGTVPGYYHTAPLALQALPYVCMYPPLGQGVAAITLQGFGVAPQCGYLTAGVDGVSHGDADGKRKRSQWNQGAQVQNMEAGAVGIASATGMGTAAHRPLKKPRALPGTHSVARSVARKCPHDRRKSRCKECGGVEICEHDRVRSRCVRGLLRASPCMYLSCMVHRLGSMHLSQTQ